MIVVIGGGAAAAEADRELNGGRRRRLDGRIHERRRPRRRRWKERFGVAFELGVVEGFALMKQSDDTVIWIKGESTSCGHIFLMEPIDKKIWAKSLVRANYSAINWEGLRLENKDQIGVGWGGVG